MSTSYRELLAKYPPKPIKSTADYQRRLATLEGLMVPHPGGGAVN